MSVFTETVEKHGFTVTCDKDKRKIAFKQVEEWGRFTPGKYWLMIINTENFLGGYYKWYGVVLSLHKESTLQDGEEEQGEMSKEDDGVKMYRFHEEEEDLAKLTEILLEDIMKYPPHRAFQDMMVKRGTPSFLSSLDFLKS